MTNTTRTLTAAASLMAVFLAPSVASAQGNCQWYATTSLKQQQQNEKLKCGYNGPSWSTDLKAHMAWCGSVPPTIWKKSAQERDQQLEQCSQSNG